jgi:hypothetical protein
MMFHRNVLSPWIAQLEIPGLQTLQRAVSQSAHLLIYFGYVDISVDSVEMCRFIK